MTSTPLFLCLFEHGKDLKMQMIPPVSLRWIHNTDDSDGVWIAQLVERWSRDWKVVGLIPSRSGRESSSSELTFCGYTYFGDCSTPVLPQWHVKDPCHPAKKCRWRVTPKNAYNLDLTKSEWAFQAWCENLLGKGAHTQLLRERLSTVVSACWVTGDWSWPKEWRTCVSLQQAGSLQPDQVGMARVWYNFCFIMYSFKSRLVIEKCKMWHLAYIYLHYYSFCFCSQWRDIEW